MPKPPKLTDADIVRAYAQRAVDHRTVRQILFDQGHTDRTAGKGIKAAVAFSLIAHSGDIGNAWITEDGLKLLTETEREQYRDALRERNMARAG